MLREQKSEESLSEVHGSIDVSKSKRGWRRLLAYMGPAYLVSVGYMDPGNWATDLAGGARFGYALIWVLLMSNLMALLLQSLSARLGIVRRRDLAQANREVYPRFVNFPLYILAELAIAATDLAEVLGMAIGLQLLTGLPLMWGVSITVLDTFLLLYLQKLGMRKMEGFIITLVGIIGFSFLIEMFLAKPAMGEVIKGFIPSIPNEDALYIAIGIIGATVMPHNLYLHSALVQTRKIANNKPSIKQALKFNAIDSTIALNAAFFVNSAILILAASVFYKSGNTGVAELKEAHRLLAPLLGTKFAPALFAIALIAAGQSSTVTGTLAGQIVMEGYLNLRINPWVRRLITRLIAIVPAVFVISIFGEDRVDSLLVFSQVILSLQLGFAIIPLIHFVSDKETMGDFAIKPYTKVLAWLIASVLIYLNVRMVNNEVSAFFSEPGNLFWKIVIILAGLFFVILFLLMTVLPTIRKKNKESTVRFHGDAQVLKSFDIPQLNVIAVALDFSKNDEKLIAHALSQGNKSTKFLLLHIVESASAILGSVSDDYETRKDQQHLDSYVAQLTTLGFVVEGQLGYRNRIKEIIRIVSESNANMLVMGAHRHSGMLDYLYGETVEKVRHQLSIPVLIVN
jgi:manganese transport protein